MTDENKSDESKNEAPKAKGRSNVTLWSPDDLHVVGLDGEPDGITRDEKRRIAELPKHEQFPALAPYKIAGLKAKFHDDANALALIDACIEDRATQPLDAGFLASCVGGVVEPIVCVNIGTAEAPFLLVIEGRQRVRSLRLVNADRAASDPPLPPYSIMVIQKNYTPRKAREIKVVTANHVSLTPLQRARRAQELLNDGISPPDVAPIVGCTSVRSLRDLLELINGKDEAVQQAVEAGALSTVAAKELKHLTPAEQKKRVEQIMAGGLKGRRALEVAKTGAASTPKTMAPARGVVDALVKRLVGSNDPLLRVVGATALWITTGADGGLNTVPGLRALIDEETVRFHGESLTASERERLLAFISAQGGEEKAAAATGIVKLTLARAVGGFKMRPRALAAIRKTLAEADAKKAA